MFGAQPVLSVRQSFPSGLPVVRGKMTDQPQVFAGNSGNIGPPQATPPLSRDPGPTSSKVTSGASDLIFFAIQGGDFKRG